MQDERRRVLGPHLGHGHRQAARLGLLGLDVARLEPAADELGRTPKPLGVGGVEGDQSLGESELVHRRIEGPRSGGATAASCAQAGCYPSRLADLEEGLAPGACPSRARVKAPEPSSDSLQAGVGVLDPGSASSP